MQFLFSSHLPSLDPWKRDTLDRMATSPCNSAKCFMRWESRILPQNPISQCLLHQNGFQRFSAQTTQFLTDPKQFTLHSSSSVDSRRKHICSGAGVVLVSPALFSQGSQQLQMCRGAGPVGALLTNTTGALGKEKVDPCFLLLGFKFTK